MGDVSEETALARSEALLGAEALARLSAARIVLVGVGGVGSWCAEALVRTGARHLVLVDDDVVAASNMNRQDEATQATLGRPKVEAMAERLQAIAPEVEIEARQMRLGDDPVADEQLFSGSPVAAVVDAIDSVGAKAALILRATQAGLPLVSSMGAAYRTDPTQVKCVRFDKVTGDGLARALRARFKKEGHYPFPKFPCVISSEPPRAPSEPGARGSLMTVTATFGLTLAAEVIKLVTRRDQ